VDGDVDGYTYSCGNDKNMCRWKPDGSWDWYKYIADGGLNDVICSKEGVSPAGFVTDDSNNINLSSAGIISKARYDADISWQGNIKMLVSFDHRATWNYWNGSLWVDSNGVNYTNAASIHDTMKALEGTRLVAGDTYLDFAIKGTENGFSDPKLHRIDIEYR
jgi:hypothetical protein